MEDAGLASQVFAVLTVIMGLASFALVLALIEQVVLEVLESNVKRGSDVYEEGHVSTAGLPNFRNLSLGEVCHLPLPGPQCIRVAASWSQLKITVVHSCTAASC